MDTDGSREISLQEAEDLLAQEKWAAYFNAEGLDVADPGWVFDILDMNRDGSIPFGEFAKGCFELKKHAKPTAVAASSYLQDGSTRLSRAEMHLMGQRSRSETAS